MRQLNTVAANLKPEIRHAIWQCCTSGEVGGPEVRELVLAGLKARGWDEDRIKKEYAAFALTCIRDDRVNPFITPGVRL
jgi:hypothetical protein